MKRFIIAALCAASLSAFADSTSGSSAGSVAQASPQNIGNPTINVNGAAPLAYTEGKVTHSGLPVSTTGTAYVNMPANDTCNEAGDALSVQVKVLGLNASKGGEMQVACDVRARALNAKYTGRSQAYINLTHCQDPNAAAVTEDEADLLEAQGAVKAFRCPDRLRPQWAKDRDAGQKRAEAIIEQRPVAARAQQLPQPWKAGG